MSPFTREHYIDAIKNALSYLKAQVELNNAINKYSINIEAETFYAGFLNVVYGFRLKNGNHTERNIPSIDLYEECRRDDGQRVTVQVTSNNSAKKVKKTLESFCTYDYQKYYTRLIILMITEKKKYRSAFSFPADIGIQFDQNKDILDVYDLLKAIEQINDTEHLRSIYDYLVKELPSWVIRIGDAVDNKPQTNELYDRLSRIFENDRKNHPSIRMMDPDPQLFPMGLPEIFSDGRLAVEEKEAPRSIRDMILDSWKFEDRRHILFIGEGGIGKSVAMLTLPEEDWLKKLGIPVIYVPLQRLDTYEGDLNRYIKEKIGFDNYEHCIELANRSSMAHPNLLLLLDGFNEIPDKFKKKAEQYIREWMERPGIQIITTSRMGFFLENSFSKYRFMPLSCDAVRSFLLSAGIVEDQLPGQKERIWEIINIPLMLVMYTQIEKVREVADRFSTVPILEWKEPDNAAHIIWDYLQMELYRCIKKCIEKNDSSYSIMQYAAALFAVAPYICSQMSYRNMFYIKRTKFHELIQEALIFYAAHQDLLGSQIRKLCQKYDPYHEENLFRKEKATKYARILIDNLAIFQEQEICREECDGEDDIDYSCSLMHQNFRDALAAFFICSCLPKTYGAKGKRALLGQAEHYVKDYMAEYLSDRELVSVWDRHRKEDPADGQITYILMDLIGRQRSYDYRELDFSGIDLTKTNLNSLLSRRLDICPLPRDRNKLSNTRISFDCLSPNGHTDRVRSVAYSPDGRRLASGGNDGTVHVWDLMGGESRVLEGTEGCVNSVAFSPDGRQLASGGSDGMVRIWNLASGKSRVLGGYADVVNSVAFSPDGRQLASGGFDGTVRIWNLASGKSRVLEGHADVVNSVAFSPDGRQLASGGNDGTVRVWDLANGESRILRCLWQLEMINMFGKLACWISSVAFSPDGRQLASGGNDGLVRVWDLASGESRVLKGPFGTWSVAFSPDGRQLASSGYGGLVRVWDLANGESRVLEGHLDGVNSIAFSPDGRQLASGGNDGTVRVWDLGGGKGRVLEGSVGIWSVAFSPNGSQVASGGGDRTVRIWDLTGGESHVLEGHTGGVKIVAFSPDGRKVASGGDDRTVRIWDLAGGKSCVLEGHEGCVNSVAFSPDGRQLASVSGEHDGTVRVWNLASGDSFMLECDIGWCDSVAFSPDGRQLATGINGRTLYVWDLASGERCMLGGHADEIWASSVGFSPDGRLVAGGTHDHMVRVWDLVSGKGCVLEGHADKVESIAFSPDGRLVASGADDGLVRVWDYASGESRILEGHAGGVKSVAFSPNGTKLVSGASDNTLRIWDLGEYREVGKYTVISYINLNSANFELAIIDEKDKELLRAAGARVKTRSLNKWKRTLHMICGE